MRKETTGRNWVEVDPPAGRAGCRVTSFLAMMAFIFFFELARVETNFSSRLAMTEVNNPPWRARQVRPPVVRPVRKMINKFVDSMFLYFNSEKHIRKVMSSGF